MGRDNHLEPYMCTWIVISYIFSKWGVKWISKSNLFFGTGTNLCLLETIVCIQTPVQSWLMIIMIIEIEYMFLWVESGMTVDRNAMVITWCTIENLTTLIYQTLSSFKVIKGWQDWSIKKTFVVFLGVEIWYELKLKFVSFKIFKNSEVNCIGV